MWRSLLSSDVVNGAAPSSAPSEWVLSETSGRVLGATRELLGEEGDVRSLTVEAVAARSGVAKTTIYGLGARDKWELALTVHRARDCREFVQRRAPGPAVEGAGPGGGRFTRPASTGCVASSLRACGRR